MSEIATGVTSSLVSRAADVVLKEKRRLVLALRETPLHGGHLRTLTTLADIGAVVAPIVPAFYNKPKTVDDIINHTVGRLLDLFGVETKAGETLGRRPGGRVIREEAMDQKTYDAGMKMRRKVAGDEYVDKAMANVDDFNRDFQRIVTQYCWGEAWGDDTLPPRERSILNLGMIACLGRMEEFQTHVRGALNNGMTPNEIRAVLTQIAVYCGIPVRRRLLPPRQADHRGVREQK